MVNLSIGEKKMEVVGDYIKKLKVGSGLGRNQRKGWLWQLFYFFFIFLFFYFGCYGCSLFAGNVVGGGFFGLLCSNLLYGLTGGAEGSGCGASGNT